MTKKFTQLVLVEPDNCSPYIERMTSNKPITIRRAWKFYEERDGFNENSDGITFISEPEEISLDNAE